MLSASNVHSIHGSMATPSGLISTIPVTDTAARICGRSSSCSTRSTSSLCDSSACQDVKRYHPTALGDEGAQLLCWKPEN